VRDLPIQGIARSTEAYVATVCVFVLTNTTLSFHVSQALNIEVKKGKYNWLQQASRL